ncbi:hypothetical protein [Lactococcus lactis]
MFKRKKFMALCATTLAGLSALGSFAPMAAFADVAKNGDTVVTYEGAPKPAEWGLSVPATIKLDKTTDGGNTAWSSGKFEIVKDDGSTFSDTSKDRTFTISGTPKENVGSADRFYLFEDGINTQGKDKIEVMMKAQDQGASEPTNWATAASGSSIALSQATFDINSKSDGSVAPSRYWVAGIHREPLQKLNYSNTMSWTATEK